MHWQRLTTGISWQNRTKGVQDHVVLGAKNKDLESRVEAKALFQSSCNGYCCLLPPSENLGVYWYTKGLKGTVIL